MLSRLFHRFRRASKPTLPPASPDAANLAASFAQLRRQIPDVATPGHRVLLATSFGAFNHGIVTDGVLALALTQRAAKVDLLLCDRFLPVCQITKMSGTPQAVLQEGTSSPRCPACFANGEAAYQALGLNLLQYSQFVSESERSAARATAMKMPIGEIRGYTPNGLPVGEHAYAGALRFFARGDLAGEANGELVLRRYLEAALLTVAAIQQMLTENQYDVVVAHHGIYVPQGLIVAVCQQRGVRVVTWNPAYRKHCFIFSHDDTYHHTMIDEPVENWRSMAWSETHEGSLTRYLKSRWHGSEDWIWFHSEPQHDIEKIREMVGYDPKKPVVSLLSNVVWDAQLHYPSNAFPGMVEWVLETIRYFSSRPDLQLVVRIHPAELRGFVPSRQPLLKEIAAVYPQLPSNVFVVPPESDVSTYALCEASNAVLIYNTKTGMEVTAQGIPTVVAGEAWIRGKGFAEDPRTPESYFQILDQLPFPNRLDKSKLLLARRYAYHIFFRRMIPIPFIQPESKTSFRIDLNSAQQLKPGNFPGLDVICDGILKGTPFIDQAELRESILERSVATPNGSRVSSSTGEANPIQ